ncbi:MAG: nuclear transport factor 2 family protein [candidate division Zixibacteria bacterium]|nr:nuclear transport factor 2 family protein [candidate division Zixibacteria bacterium]
MENSGVLKLGFMSILLTIILLNCSGQNPEQLVEKYETLYNSHDVEKLMSLYSDEAVFEVVGLFKLSDTEKIRGVAQYDSALDLTMTISDIKVRGDTAFFKLQENNDWLHAMEIEAAYYDPAYIVFRKNLVYHIKAEASPETMEAFKTAMEGFWPWANENAANRLAEMIPDGEFIYNAQNAVKVVKIINEYKASMKNK